MSSATIIVTKRNIAAREAKILELRAAARKLSPKSKGRKAIRAQITKLLTELAALRASLHYYKPTAELTEAIAGQRKVVKALTAAFKKATGAVKFETGKQLRKEAKKLNEMLAAAHAQQVGTGARAPLPVSPPPPTLVEVAHPNPIGTETSIGEEEAPAESMQEEAKDEAAEAEDAAAVPAEFKPSEFSMEALPEFASQALSVLDESWEKLDDYRDEEGGVWYKNPIVLLGAGAAVYLVLRRS